MLGGRGAQIFSAPALRCARQPKFLCVQIETRGGIRYYCYKEIG
jgi:hypothetical protein